MRKLQKNIRKFDKILQLIFLFYFFIGVFIHSNAQVASKSNSPMIKKMITLDQLQNLAKDAYPILKQKELYKEYSTNKQKQIETNFLPQINVVGQATYQSEVTTLNFSIPGAPAFAQKADQYSAGIELKENILDYGLVKSQKKIEGQNAEIQAQQVDIEYQKIKDRVNQLFGNICLQQDNKKIMFLRLNEISTKYDKMKSAVENGVVLKSNLLVLESESLSTEQKIDEINSNLVAWYRTLSILTNTSMDTNFEFRESQMLQIQKEVIRPELKLFELQSNTNKLRESILFKNNLPKLFVFARGYYGRPGYNFLDNNFRTYGLIGAGFSWNLSSFYTYSKEIKNLKINNDIVANQKAIFDLNLQTILVQQKEEINKLEKMILLDIKISKAKEAVRKSSSSQLDNGVISSSDYIVDLNAENVSQYNLKLHQIQLIMAKQNYNNTLGY